jgi:hypothetical protein
VVLKADAKGMVHKTEAGAVKLDLRGNADVAVAYRDLTTARPWTPASASFPRSHRTRSSGSFADLQQFS